MTMLWVSSKDWDKSPSEAQSSGQLSRSPQKHSAEVCSCSAHVMGQLNKSSAVSKKYFTEKRKPDTEEEEAEEVEEDEEE